MQEQETQEEIAKVERKELPKRHIVHLINGQPVCTSCEYHHTMKVNMVELEKQGRVVVDFS